MSTAPAARRVAVFGLGYVGSVSAACLATRGHSVIGVDVRSEKVDMINRGRSPVVEERLGDLVAEQVAAGSALCDNRCRRAVANTDIALVCVGTPSASNGSLMTEFLERVSEEIGAALAGRRSATPWSSGRRCCRRRASRLCSRACRTPRACVPARTSVWPSTPSSCARAVRWKRFLRSTQDGDRPVRRRRAATLSRTSTTVCQARSTGYRWRSPR